jgi:DnaJ family protein C protein 27
MSKYTNKLSIKLISIGDVEVGKSCLIKRYCEGSFVSDYITTIGIDYGVKKVPFSDTLVAINIFDLSGDDDYKEVRIHYYKDSMGVLMVYDSNIKATFDSLVRWEKEASNNGLDISKCVFVVFGNKTDIKKKEVKTDVAKEWAKSRGYMFYEGSAKSGGNVNEAFKKLFEEMFQKTIENRAKYIY